MLRRSVLTVVVLLLAVVVLPATALSHHRRQLVRSSVPGSNVPAESRAPQPEVPWMMPLLEAIPALFFLFGAVPGIIATSKGMPNWMSYFWGGLVFGFLFLPAVFVLLYKVLKWKETPMTNQTMLRPPNIVVPAGGRESPETRVPVNFQDSSNP
jgi:hypothetical protein